MIGLVAFTIILLTLAAAEAVGLYEEHTGKQTWLPLTDYIRKSPLWIRWPVLLFCIWLVYHFSLGVVDL